MDGRFGYDQNIGNLLENPDGVLLVHGFSVLEGALARPCPEWPGSSFAGVNRFPAPESISETVQDFDPSFYLGVRRGE